MSERGFTLVEVLVALAIVATALMASLRAVGEMSATSKELELRLLADLSAQIAANETGVFWFAAALTTVYR